MNLRRSFGRHLPADIVSSGRTPPGRHFEGLYHKKIPHGRMMVNRPTGTPCNLRRAGAFGVAVGRFTEVVWRTVGGRSGGRCGRGGRGRWAAGWG